MSDTEPSELKPVMDTIARLEGAVKEHERTIGAALSSLRSLILQHYAAVQTRADDHARRLARLEEKLSLPPLEPLDPPRALPDRAA